MDICLLSRHSDGNIFQNRNFLHGDLSCIAKGKTLFSEKGSDGKCDVLFVMTDTAEKCCASAIYDEAILRNARAVFLDSGSETSSDFEEICKYLTDKKMQVFTPLFQKHIQGTTPVITSSLTGGCLFEYFEEIHARFDTFAVSIERMSVEFPLPCGRNDVRTISSHELRSKIARYSPDIFFSPQMQCKYFLYTPDNEHIFAVLFDDAETLSGKLRLSKKHGASHAFLVASEISGILNDIIF